MLLRFAAFSSAYLFLALPVAVAQTTEPCVPAGKCVDLEFDRPPIDAPGMPTSASWSGGTGNPEGWDQDDWTGNDNMGDAVPNRDGSTVTVTVCNHGGEMVGPNGAIVEGGLEGNCVEVYAVWYYDYVLKREICFYNQASVGAGNGLVSVGVGGGSIDCYVVQIHVQGWVRVGYDNPTLVCPC